MELVACFAAFLYIDNNDPVEIQNNFCYGAPHGWALPHVKCSEIQTHNMKNNVAGSCGIGFIINTISSQCSAFSHSKAFSCGLGHIQGPPSIVEVRYSNLVMAENGRSVTLKLGAK